jgi:hypothetical protein
MRRIFGPKRNEVTGGWRTLHNEELRDLHSLPNTITIFISRKIKLAGHVARIGEKRIVCRLLAGKLEEDGSLGGPRLRWVVNIKMAFVEIGWCGVNWSGLAQGKYR